MKWCTFQMARNYESLTLRPELLTECHENHSLLFQIKKELVLNKNLSQFLNRSKTQDHREKTERTQKTQREVIAPFHSLLENLTQAVCRSNTSVVCSIAASPHWAEQQE